MRKLLIPKHVFREIVGSVLATRRGCETGVTLFGARLEEEATREVHYIVLAIAGPGRRAVHEPAHYSGDENHANEIYDALQSALPAIHWIGELHAHPRGMTWLSGGDLETVRQILTGVDETLHPDEFIAGVIQRKEGTVDIYPVHFTREWIKGRAMEIQIVDSDAPMIHQARLKALEKGNKSDQSSICTERQGSRTTLEEAPRHHWLRQWWQRFGRNGRAGGHRQIHAD
jgi:hypothetical protein